MSIKTYLNKRRKIKEKKKKTKIEHEKKEIMSNIFDDEKQIMLTFRDINNPTNSVSIFLTPYQIAVLRELFNSKPKQKPAGPPNRICENL